MKLGATSGRGAICLPRARARVKFALPISPSQVRPVETHRLQEGLLSSHFTFRILEERQSIVDIKPEYHAYLQVLQPFLEGLVA